MKAILETPQGVVTATIQDGYIGNAQVDPDGVVVITFFPMDRPPDDEDEGFINE